MRCLACNKEQSEVDARAKYDHGEYYDLCGGCRFFVKTYGAPIHDPDVEIVFEPVDDAFDAEDISGMRLAFGRAERREHDEDW